MEEWLTRRPVTAEIAGSNPVILVMVFLECIPTCMKFIFDGLEEYVELFPVDPQSVVYLGNGQWECSSIGLEHRLVTPKVAGSSPVFLVAK